MMKPLNTGIGDKNYYDRYLGRKPKFYRYILADIIQFSKPGKILDIGAGTGLFVELSTQWGFHCEGIDGVKINPKIKVHKFSRKFPYKDESYQTIIINQVIQYLEPEVLTNVLKESYRMLVNDGALIIYSPNRRIGTEFTTPVSPKKLKTLLRIAGFKNLLNKSSAGNLLLFALYKLTNSDLIANTSNFIAYKTGNNSVH